MGSERGREIVLWAILPVWAILVHMGNILKDCYVQKCCVKEESLIVNKKVRYSNDGTVGKIITNNFFFRS